MDGYGDMDFTTFLYSLQQKAISNHNLMYEIPGTNEVNGAFLMKILKKQLC